ncbi:hypothetical protein EG329_011446 [Mollisiaceae sp. DMI_Dod_QoI]|nr:hypothetical protein EG329_011446 [Helotiales sp. DMI_Dod_QoI]
MATPPFKTPPQAPPNFNTTPEQLISDTRAIIDKTRNLQDTIIASIGPENATFANVLLPLAQDENHSLRRRKISKFYGSTSTSAAMRDASNASEVLFNEFDSHTLIREELFQLINAVFHREENLDAESQFYVERKHQEFTRNGIGIEDVGKRAKLAEIKNVLHEKITISKNSINTSSGIWLSIGDLDGLPDSTLKDLKKGEGGNAAKLWLPLKKPHLETALKHANNPATRRRLYVGNDNRCLENVPRLKEIILLRDEAARLLGYRNHAEFQLEMKMAGTTDSVNNFLSDIREKLTPIAKTDLGSLMELKCRTSNEALANLDEQENSMFYVWDSSFYTNLTKVQTYSFDEKKFSEYFALERTLAGMMTTLFQLFSLHFLKITPEDYSNFGTDHVMTWHDSVSVFSVWNNEKSNGDFVGYLYLDLFPRENKYNHAGHYLLQPGYISKDGKYHHPSSALVMNLPSPQPQKPTLLSHDCIRSLFHELGHAIHNLVPRTKFAIFHGTSTTRDFVEIPSIMLENWWWTPSVIKELGRHYSYESDEMLKAWEENEVNGEQRPDESLDDETIRNLVGSRRTNEALATLRQCHVAMFDMAIHSPSSREEAERMNISELWNKMMSEVALMNGLEVEGEGWEWGHGSSRLGAIIRGYDAGYYSYPLGKAYAQDLFTSLFEKDPMDEDVGMRYRKIVLEKGASRNGMELLEEFLGRKPNAVARYRELGLI